MVLAFTAAVSTLTVIVFGLTPALRSTRVDLVAALKESAPGVRGGTWQLGKLFVIGQVALSLVLLIGAGLFIRTLRKLETGDVGYSRADLLLLQVDPALSGYGASQQLTVMRSLVDALGSVAGVRDVTVSENGLFTGIDSGFALRIEGFTPVGKEDTLCNADQVGPRYFQVLGVPMLAGRDFTEHDNARAPLVPIINETMARFYGGKSSPVGKRILNGGDRYTIIGVVRDMRERSLKGKPERRLSAPLLQTTDRINPFNFEIRTQIDASQAIPSIRRKLASFNRNLDVLSLAPVRTAMDASVGEERFIAQLCGVFSGLALLLAGIGVYGVMSYAISRRAGEIGMRMALGAGQRRVIGMVLRETMLVLLVGIAIGLPVALGATRLISAMLAGFSVNDPLAFGAAILALLLIGVAAGFVPAARAARINPIAALRQE